MRIKREKQENSEERLTSITPPSGDTATYKYLPTHILHKIPLFELVLGGPELD